MYNRFLSIFQWPRITRILLLWR